MKRIGILTAGGDTPALNATIYGTVTQANAHGIEVYGIMKGFDGILDPQVPHVHLNPLFSTIPELDPSKGGTILGASRTYIDPDETDVLSEVASRLHQLRIEGLVCIGGDGTLNGMQPLTDKLPCVLAPKTIDNDLGLNYLDEPNEWVREAQPGSDETAYQRIPNRDEVVLDEIINYATPGYSTAVSVAAAGIERTRTTAESHRRIAIIEVMGRQSGYIALGSAYGQPDIILIPEIPLDYNRFEQRVRELYDLQKHVVVVIGEGVTDEEGHALGAKTESYDPAGNVIFSGAAEHLKHTLSESLGDEFFKRDGRHQSASRAVFTRKVGHTQRGGRPIQFDRFHAAQLGGKAVDLLLQGHNNTVAILQWSTATDFFVDELPANKLRDQWQRIHPREVHPSLFDEHRFQPSQLGVEYLLPLFTNAIGQDDAEYLRATLFNPGKLSTRYQSTNIDMQKRTRYL